MGEGTLASFSPFYNPDIDFSYTVAGAAAACYCFLGFDALTTFTEDTIDPTKNIPRSINTDTARMRRDLPGSNLLHSPRASVVRLSTTRTTLHMISLRQVAPSIFGGIFLIGTIAGQFAAGLSAQASGARLLYAMGRDGVLPKKFFGKLNHKTQTPDKCYHPDWCSSTVRCIPRCYKGYSVHQLRRIRWHSSSSTFLLSPTIS